MGSSFEAITKENSPHFTHFISLGYFCSVAMELERYGFRNASYPFDWLITPYFDQVIRAIDTHFDGMLDYNALEQDTTKRQIYHDRGYRFSFVHDFDKYTPLSEQLPDVQDKFRRRIDRFYRDITEPTLFLRYINDELESSDDCSEDKQYREPRETTCKPAEILWIESNLDYILSTIRQYNPDNDILWIANDGVTSNLIRIYNVEKDSGDDVARRPFERNPELGSIFDGFDIPDREQNLQRYLDKERRKTHLFYRLRQKSLDTLNSAFRSEYIHTNEQIDLK